MVSVGGDLEQVLEQREGGEVERDDDRHERVLGPERARPAALDPGRGERHRGQRDRRVEHVADRRRRVRRAAAAGSPTPRTRA